MRGLTWIHGKVSHRVTAVHGSLSRRTFPWINSRVLAGHPSSWYSLTVEHSDPDDDDNDTGDDTKYGTKDDARKPGLGPSSTNFVPGTSGKRATLAAQQPSVRCVLNRAIDHELLHLIFLKNSFPREHERKPLLLGVLTGVAKAIGEADVYQRLLSDTTYQNDMCRIVSFSLSLHLHADLHHYCLCTLISSR
jgi:hypothetical protein